MPQILLLLVLCALFLREHLCPCLSLHIRMFFHWFGLRWHDQVLKLNIYSTVGRLMEYTYLSSFALSSTMYQSFSPAREKVVLTQF